MTRWTAWVILLAAAGLIYSLAFTSYDQFSGSWQSTESGGLVKVTVECPAPFRVLVFDAGPDRVGDLDQPDFCVPSSRTLAFEAGVVALAAGLLLWKPVTRRRPESISPISDKIDLSLREKE